MNGITPAAKLHLAPTYRPGLTVFMSVYFEMPYQAYHADCSSRRRLLLSTTDRDTTYRCDRVPRLKRSLECPHLHCCMVITSHIVSYLWREFVFVVIERVTAKVYMLSHWFPWILIKLGQDVYRMYSPGSDIKLSSRVITSSRLYRLADPRTVNYSHIPSIIDLLWEKNVS